MLSTVQVYVEATIAIALMVTIGIITGFIAAGVTEDRAVQLWRWLRHDRGEWCGSRRSAVAHDPHAVACADGVVQLWSTGD